MPEFEPKQFGRFYLLEKLAVGGMAEIYKAKTFGAEGFEKLLAIKRILPHCSADKDFISMLIDEAKLSVMLSHANVVQVYDLGKVGDDFFISMEYINGVNLRDILYRARERLMRMPTELAVYIISEVCKGLDYAHRKTDSNAQPLNIVHRDISPQNVLISYEGEVKIVDFGIAKAAMNISHTMAGILKGKIAYMSPEQALGKAIDYRTDLFSTGIILYECLTGEKLFTGESQFEVLKKIRTTKIDATRLPAGIPKPLQQVLIKALTYFPKDRFQGAGDMQIELTKFLYSTYHDFSPQKLAGHVKALFQDELERQLRQAALQRQMEAQTSSINLAQDALQQDIVVRDDTTGITVKTAAKTATPATAPPPRPKRPTSEEITAKTAQAHRRAVGLRIVATIGIVATVALSTFAYVRFLHPRLFPPPDVEPMYGVVSVNSNPAGAHIFLDGRDLQQTTPAVVTNLTLHTPYKLRLAKENYADLEQTITITSTTPVSLALTLSEAGSAALPPGSAPLVPQVPESLTPAQVSGSPTPTGSAALPPQVSGSPTPTTGVLVITSDPPGAAIGIDGKPTGKITPDTVSGLTLNTEHTVTLTKEAYQAFAKVITLRNPTPQDLATTLLKGTATAPTTPTTPATPTAAQFGSIYVTSNPSGATILLNGRSTGKVTPATVGNIAVLQRYTVSVVKKDFEGWTRAFTLTEPTTKSIGGDLRAKSPEKIAVTPSMTPPEKTPPEKTPPAITPPEKMPELVETTGGPGTIKVSSSPSGAEVFVNGESRGRTPASIAGLSGPVKVLVTKEGFAPYSTRVTVKPGQTVSLGMVQLGDLYGEVSISSSPVGAMVYIDGQATAKTPVTIRKVRRDKGHSVRVVLDGHRPWERSFTFGSEGEKRFHADLQEQ